MTKIYKTHSLLPHNTFGIDATAENFVEFSLVDDIVAFLSKGFDGRSLVIGGGSKGWISFYGFRS